LIVTVDGPAAAGKSSVARELARRLNSRYLDSGAMYRAVTWKALECGADLTDAGELARVAREARLDLQFDPDGVRVLCDARDVTREIRTPRVTGRIYHLADEPEVRRALIEQQRDLGRRYDLVAEGRDQGTEVFPCADVKFYLDASLDERARRRRRDLAAEGSPSLDEVKKQLAERDAMDRSRPMGALHKDEDMIVVDSTGMSVAEVVETMLREIERLRVGPGHS
jgi:cytidylate kinase